MNDQEALRVESNISVIMGYMASQFEGFLLQVKEHPPVNVRFTITNRTTSNRFTLEVLWSMLSETGNTAAVIQRKLTEQNIAERLRRSTGIYFWNINAEPEPSRSDRVATAL
jgi:hypothetical protein